MSIASPWRWECTSGSTCIGKIADLANISLVKFNYIPDTAEQVDIVLQKIDEMIYTNSECGFGVIFDISGTDMQLRQWWVLMQTGKFFQGMEMSKRSKASQGIAIIVRSPDAQMLVNRVAALFPSPVKVNCYCSLDEAIYMFESSSKTNHTPYTRNL